MKSLASLRRRLAALCREADSKTGTAERCARARAGAADLWRKLTAEILRRQASPTASPGPAVDLATVEGTDSITRMLITRVRAEREENRP